MLQDRRWPQCSTSTLKSVIADNIALFTSIKVYDGRQRCLTDSHPWDFCAKSLPQGLNDLSKNIVWPAFCSSSTKFPYPSRNLLVRLTGRDEIAFTRPAREVMWEIMHVSLNICGIWIFLRRSILLLLVKCPLFPLVFETSTLWVSVCFLMI